MLFWHWECTLISKEKSFVLLSGWHTVSIFINDTCAVPVKVANLDEDSPPFTITGVGEYPTASYRILEIKRKKVCRLCSLDSTVEHDESAEDDICIRRALEQYKNG